MWNYNYIFDFLIQLLLIWCAHVTYFHKTILTGLKTQTFLNLTPPADRLVVFVVDGLSAKVFFENDCQNVPQLQEIFLHQGQVGISRTVDPTECWSAHLPTFTGVYQHPLPFCGWTGSVAAYDSVFMHSTRSYAWGSARLLNHFPAIHKAHINNNGLTDKSPATFILDGWTFLSVNYFVESTAHKMQIDHGVLYIIHIQGLRHANSSEMFYEFLKNAQHDIWTTYKRFEKAFPNRRTAYLLTSDHGMTSKGYKPYNRKDVLETPLLVWGAGISNLNSTRSRTFVANKTKHRLPLHVVQQTQLAPLMSALLGLPPPVHSRAQLPVDLLDVSMRYASYATYITARQLRAQCVRLLQRFEEGLLSSFMPTYWLSLSELDYFIHNGNLLWQQQRYLILMEHSDNLMPSLLQCVEYYENYYAGALLLATVLGYIGWLHHLRCLASKVNAIYTEPSLAYYLVNALVRVFLILLVAFLLLQRVPWVTSSVLLITGLIWTRALKVHESVDKLWSCRHITFAMLLSTCCITGFFQRRTIAVGYLIFGCYNNRRSFVMRSTKFYIWFVMICLLTAISWLPPSMGYWHRHLLVASMIITFVRPIACRSVQYCHNRHWLYNGLVLLLACLHVLHCTRPWLMHLIARAHLGYVFYPRFGKRARELTLFNLCTLYTLLCTSYEALVIQLLVMELQLALILRKENEVCNSGRQIVAMYMLLYSFYSFFAIGNFEAVDRFLSDMQFTGFGIYSDLINILVIGLKLVVPIVLLICIIYINCDRAWVDRQQIFYRLLIMCNIMAVVLLFRVRNIGSSWEISIRIQQFLIVQILPFILLCLGYLVHYLLSIKSSENVEIPKCTVHKY